MGSEYQGWVGEGRELFRGEEKSETEEAESRESYNVRNISAGSMIMILFSTIIVIIISTGGKFPDQSCPTLRSASSSHICWTPDLNFWNPFIDSHLPTSLWRKSLTRMASALHQLSVRLLAWEEKPQNFFEFHQKEIWSHFAHWGVMVSYGGRIEYKLVFFSNLEKILKTKIMIFFAWKIYLWNKSRTLHTFLFLNRPKYQPEFCNFFSVSPLASTSPPSFYPHSTKASCPRFLANVISLLWLLTFCYCSGPFLGCNYFFI